MAKARQVALGMATCVLLNIAIFPTILYSQVSNYSELRSLSGSEGATTVLQNPSTSRFDGVFRWVSSPPFSGGDDGTIVFNASGGGYWIRDFSHAATSPVQLGWYEQYAEGANITSWLRTMADKFAPDLHIEATTVAGITSVRCDYINWPAEGITRDFSFLEDSGLLTIKYTGSGDEFTMWRFASFNKVRIGGSSLFLTFEGTRNGLGENPYGDTFINGSGSGGIVEFAVSGFDPSLLVWQANMKHAKGRGIQVSGSADWRNPYSSASRIDSVFVAGTFWNAGQYFNSGVQTLYFDPENTVVADPFGAIEGWIGNETGCIDRSREMFKGFGYAGGNSISRMVGGLTTKYGHVQLRMLHVGEIGNGPNEPFVLTIEDYGVSGPTSETGLPEGVHIRKGEFDPTGTKEDGTPEIGPNKRFLKIVEGSHRFGAGHRRQPNSGTGCSSDARNARYGGPAFLWRGESSTDSPPAYTSSYTDVTLDGTWTDWYDFYDPADLIQGDCTHCSNDGAASYGHTFRLTSQTTGVNGNGADRTTFTGAGEWKLIRINNKVGHACSGNTVTNTRVSGSILIASGCTNTSLTSVAFTGPAREVMVIGSGSDVNASNVSAAVGSVITGSGSLTLNGNPVSLPYEFTGSEGDGNLPPEAVSDEYQVSSSGTLNVPASTGVKANDTDAQDGSPPGGAATLLSGPSHHAGSFSLSPDGSFSYVHNGSSQTSDSFTYRVADSQGALSNVAAVTIRIVTSDPSSSSQNINLKSGWNAVSLNVRPDTLDVEEVVSPISEDLILLKNGAGEIYYPELGINSIGSWDVEDGYQLNVASNSNLQVSGTQVIASESPINLSSGWNLVPFLPQRTQAVADAFVSILDTLILVKSNDGNIYYPELGIYTLENAVPGEAYQVYTSGPTVLVYPD